MNLGKITLIKYLLKFLFLFRFLYFGTKVVIGFASPAGYYSPFIYKYFNYPSWIRWSLLYGTKIILWLFGYATYFPSQFKVKVINGYGVKLVYSCLGIGVMSFWAAFVFANSLSWNKKLKWIFGGLLIIWLINVFRLTSIVIFANKSWHFYIDNQ